ncbi:hypothetical protein CC2G_005108 [Coprinopsis cinerea AmutBmut pab1-1]|nr:hypothetical protein CC2G_005108 [Coprinopsis cinerea AmutBmut pab1-1]
MENQLELKTGMNAAIVLLRLLLGQATEDAFLQSCLHVTSCEQVLKVMYYVICQTQYCRRLPSRIQSSSSTPRDSCGVPKPDRPKLAFSRN